MIFNNSMIAYIMFVCTFTHTIYRVYSTCRELMEY